MGTRVTTLCLAHRHPEILLGLKKRGFGAGRWNGFGGKVHASESIEESAKRELLEEVCITARILSRAGILNFTFEDTAEHPIECHLFRIEDFEGEPRETEEMRPEWFHVDAIPFDEMWPGDRDWLPLFLEKVPFKGYFHFKDHDTVLRSEVVRL
jgi:8-oxo-dGTP diphosphatase/2-hydroxy-dATP diphosphatase